MEKEKAEWLKSIGAKEFPEPIKYVYTFPGYNGAFNLSERYVEETELEELKAQYEKNKPNASTETMTMEGGFKEVFDSLEVGEMVTIRETEENTYIKRKGSMQLLSSEKVKTEMLNRFHPQSQE